MSEEKFQSLNDKVDKLASLCSEIKRENMLLKANHHNWHAERVQLLERNKETKTKLESVLVRLKSMDQS
ncbi:MAG: hypothetical protein COC19_02020 [SAR86 cluster bacterium]|uniref:TIGR02449 family protein n=1 Tax=SAR86 cluster bacterium TaxID=2030880 RepID=A0A2A4MT83_9GAMM|nr:MAG: hypothetical protein COC19_02020 [SAR86 cluster bacterium]